MKVIQSVQLSLVGMLLMATTVSADRVREQFNHGWQFYRGDESAASQPTFNDSGWRTLDLPHDWSIEQPFSSGAAAGWRGGYVHLGTGWYRKTFRITPKQRNQRVYIEFGGIYKDSEVWLNGTSLGRRWYGYSSFRYDLTPHLNSDGDNVLAVRVHNPNQTCRWYTGSGIYRPVWLETTDNLAVAHWGTQVTTPTVTPEVATVSVRTAITNSYNSTEQCSVLSEIQDPMNKVVSRAETTATLEAAQSVILEQEFSISNPSLWSSASPVMYSLKTTVRSRKGVVDSYITPFGIRKIEWDATKHGIVVNGTSEFLNGVNIHHDLGCLGAAFNERAMERRLELLKKMGCNAIRMAHNPPAEEVLDLCDRMGFYVINEAFDKWGPSRYATFEKDWPADLEAVIRRDRNHPCVVLWSVGNENWAYRWPRSRDMYNQMTEVAKKHDNTRKFTAACSPGKYVAEAGQMDVASLNYHEGILDPYLKQLPDKVIIISESYSYYSGKDGNAKAFHPVNPTVVVKQHPQVAGTFIWTGIDYLGEAKGKWPMHGWNATPIDTCAIPKPVGYLNQSLWSKTPMVHIAVLSDKIKMPRLPHSHWGWPNMASHWTFPQLEGETVEIKVFSNCEEVELRLNGESLGRKKLADFADRMISWKDVAYAPGKLQAVGYVDGKPTCNHDLTTSGPAVRLVLEPDRKTISADGRDISHLIVTAVDARGVRVPSANHKVSFDISGAGILRAVDNGDLTNTEPYIATERTLFNGRCMAIVQSRRSPGEIMVTATAPDLEPVTGVISSRSR